MIPTQPKPRGSSKFAPLNGRRRKSSRGKGIFISSCVTLAIIVLAGAVFAMQHMSSFAAPVHNTGNNFGHSSPFVNNLAHNNNPVNNNNPGNNFAHNNNPVNNNNNNNTGHNNAITTIGGLKKISQVGSASTVLDAQGKKIVVDSNPYKIALTPGWGGFANSDLLVSNFGNTARGNDIIDFRNQMGPARLFNQKRMEGLSGPAGLVFDKQTNSLWIANSAGNDIVLLRSNGTLLSTVKNPLFKGPWGLTMNGGNSGNGYNNSHNNGKVSFFTSNDVDGKILRIDTTPQRQGMPKTNVVQIGQLDKTGKTTFIDLLWVPSLKLNNHTWNDVLLALDPAHNRVLALPNSSSANMHSKWVTAFQGKPLNVPGGLTINPLNGDLLVVNTRDNNLVELNLTQGKVVSTKQIDPKAVDRNGNGAALFGVLAMKDKKGNLEVFFTDDNSNTLNLLSAS